MWSRKIVLVKGPNCYSCLEPILYFCSPGMKRIRGLLATCFFYKKIIQKDRHIYKSCETTADMVFINDFVFCFCSCFKCVKLWTITSLPKLYHFWPTPPHLTSPIFISVWSDPTTNTFLMHLINSNSLGISQPLLPSCVLSTYPPPYKQNINPSMFMFLVSFWPTEKKLNYKPTCTCCK